jgi:hypothetical protein
LSAALCAALLLAPAVAANAFDPEGLGARPGADPAVNTRAIQEALDAAAAAGGGTVALKTPGVYDLAAQGPNPYHPGHRYCLELRGNGLTLSIGPEVTLRLANDQQGSETGAVDVVVWRARQDLRITGGGTISGNTDGQRFWSRQGAYTQITSGNLVAGYGSLDARNERIRIDGVTLQDHFSDAIYLSGDPRNRDRDIRISDVHARETGEGILVMNADDVTLSGNQYQATRVPDHPGDGFELWDVAGFRMLRNAVRGRLGGSGIDLFGARDGVVDGFSIEGGVEGLGIQENTALGTYAEKVEVKNGIVTLAGAGTGVFTKGARVRHVTIESVTVQGGRQPGTIGFQISMDNVEGRPSDDWRQQGPVTLEDCRALGNDVGLLIKTVAGLTISGGDYSVNVASPSSDGIRWMGQSNAYRRADTRDLVIRGVRAYGNRRYGIHIDGQRLVGREPRGTITECAEPAVDGKGATRVHIGSVGSLAIARDIAFDASCAPKGVRPTAPRPSGAARPSPRQRPSPAAPPSPAVP